MLPFEDYYKTVLPQIKELHDRGLTTTEIIERTRGLDLYAQFLGLSQNLDVLPEDTRKVITERLNTLKELMPGIVEIEEKKRGEQLRYIEGLNREKEGH